MILNICDSLGYFLQLSFFYLGLPPDITKEEFVEVMSKCGIIMRDPQTEEPKIKLYKDKEGNLKGDGLCCYLKVTCAFQFCFQGDASEDVKIQICCLPSLGCYCFN